MSEEEKKAIEKLSGKKNETTWIDTIRQIKREEITDIVVTRQKYITILLNLVEKQQKEIEELKKHKEHEQEYQNGEVFSAKQMYYIEENYIDKDKIRKIINNTEENIEEDRPSIVLENLILNIKELLKE